MGYERKRRMSQSVLGYALWTSQDESFGTSPDERHYYLSLP